MKTRKPTAADIERAIEDAHAADVLAEINSMSREEVDRTIREGGGDPNALATGLTDFVNKQRERRERLSWQLGARERLESNRARVAERASSRPTRTRAETIARIAALRADPRFTAPAAALFKSRTADESTDKDLEALLDELELLAELHDRDANEKD